LAAMLLPALARAKAKAQQINCVSNLKQLELAYAMYQGDFGGKGINYFDDNGNYTLWMDALINYQGKVDKIRLCPVATDRSPAANGRPGSAIVPWQWDLNNPKSTGSYALNFWLYDSEAAAVKPSDKTKFFGKESGITHPSATPAFMDSLWVDAAVKADSPIDANWDFVRGGKNGAAFGEADMKDMDRILVARHPIIHGVAKFKQPLPGKSVMAFADGHAELIKHQDIKTFYWHKDYIPVSDPWNTTAP
ncbi:MAG TPA: hypothetical protein VFM25_12750, partial [Verrucomicrobiae bacterium]|nr:hypothetical protein [Verrucomicrobiae bacterium]